MRVLSVNIGRPAIVLRAGLQYSTAMNRRPAVGPVELTLEGFAGDRVSDLRVHGGPDKAICVYPHEHYAYFSDRLGAMLEVPAFGENLTTQGWVEEDVCIGDTLRIGRATVQVSQPRQPCAKLARKHLSVVRPAWINERTFTGFYLRVVEAGPIAAGDAIELIERCHVGLTVARATRALRSVPPDADALRRLIDTPEFSASWHKQARQRLGLAADDHCDDE